MLAEHNNNRCLPLFPVRVTCNAPAGEAAAIEHVQQQNTQADPAVTSLFNNARTFVGSTRTYGKI